MGILQKLRPLSALRSLQVIRFFPATTKSVWEGSLRRTATVYKYITHLNHYFVPTFLLAQLSASDLTNANENNHGMSKKVAKKCPEISEFGLWPRRARDLRLVAQAGSAPGTTPKFRANYGGATARQLIPLLQSG